MEQTGFYCYSTVTWFFIIAQYCCCYGHGESSIWLLSVDCCWGHLCIFVIFRITLFGDLLFGKCRLSLKTVLECDGCMVVMVLDALANHVKVSFAVLAMGGTLCEKM